MAMATAFEEISKNVMQLTNQQRLALAGFLLETDNLADDPTIDVVWEQEIQKRIAVIDSGNVKGVSYADVMREANNRLS